eukprot:3297701-Amphidinium_carterae.1
MGNKPANEQQQTRDRKTRDRNDIIMSLFVSLDLGAQDNFTGQRVAELAKIWIVGEVHGDDRDLEI